MYIPKDNRVSLTTAQALLQRYDFGALISAQDRVPTASHVPFLYQKERGPLGSVSAHLARANPQAEALKSAPEILLIAQGPHGYVSPSWYTEHPSVPTWNYVAVHVTGRARIVSDPLQVRSILAALVDRNESGREKPWKMDLSETYLQGMLRGIVAFEVDITSIEGKLKLSQNRTHEEQESVIRGLEESGDPVAKDLAAVMREHKASS